MRPSDFPERFASKIRVEENGCWIWTAARHTEGYGLFSIRRRSVLAHRFAYRFVHGEIPAGLMLDHLCRTPLCVNPDHLEVVTNRENVLRGEHPHAIAHREARCTRGHRDEFYRRQSGPRKGEVAYCLACRREDQIAA